MCVVVLVVGFPAWVYIDGGSFFVLVVFVVRSGAMGVRRVVAIVLDGKVFVMKACFAGGVAKRRVMLMVAVRRFCVLLAGPVVGGIMRCEVVLIRRRG